MTTEAGKATETPGAGSVPAVTPITPAGKADATPTIPTDVMPLVEKLFDERLAKVLPAKQAEWKQSQDQEKKQAEMTELEKATAKTAELQAQLTTANANYTRESRVRELVGKAVPSLMAEGIVNRLGDGFTIEKAVEMANAELAPLKAGSGVVTPFPGAGGSPGASSESLSDEQIQDAVRSGRMKLADANALWDQRKLSASGAKQ